MSKLEMIVVGGLMAIGIGGASYGMYRVDDMEYALLVNQFPQYVTPEEAEKARKYALPAFLSTLGGTLVLSATGTYCFLTANKSRNKD